MQDGQKHSKNAVLKIFVCCVLLSAVRIRAFEKVLGPEGGGVRNFTATTSREFALGKSSLYFRNSGEKSWAMLQHPPSTTYNVLLLDKHLQGQGDLLILGYQSGSTFLSRDEGRTWSDFSNERGSFFHLCKHGIFLRDLNSKGRGLFRSRDTGKTWQTYMPEYQMFAAVDAGDGLIVSAGKDEESGLFWIDMATGEHKKIDTYPDFYPGGMQFSGNGSGGVLIGTEGYGLLRYDRAGNRFETVIPPAPGEYNWAAVAWNGSKAYALSIGEESVMASSHDTGKTWQIQRGIAPLGNIMAILPREDHIILSSSFFGPARLDLKTLQATSESGGIREGILIDFRLAKDFIYSPTGIDKGVYRARFRSDNWERVLDSEARLFEFGDVVYHQSKSGYVRFQESEGETDTLPLLDSSWTWTDDLIDAGSWTYAVGNRLVANPRPPHTVSGLFGARKGDSAWTRLPFPYCSSLGKLAAQGASLLSVCYESISFKQERDTNWTRLEGLPFQKPNSVHFSGGQWIVSTEKGLYQSSDPLGEWSRLFPSSDTVEIVGAKGQKLLIRQGQDRFRYSPDQALTWVNIAMPFPAGLIHRIGLSDSLLCVSGGPGEELHCQDLLPATLGIQSRWVRIKPSTPARFFDRSRMLFLDPRGSSRAVPRTLDGRAAVQGASRRE